ncbi:MAG TPA: sugar ABC transporter substrate-binding protein [Chloroflexota bacterium]|nr:sugar ABC transporter substrate-binding protein [Chloroflexota bacterium]
MSGQEQHRASTPSRATFLRTAAGVAGTAGALSLGVPGAMADKVGRPLRKTAVKYVGLYWLGSEIKKNLDLVAQFNKQSTLVKVQYVQSSWSAIANQMTVAFSSGDVPDIFQYYDAGLVPWGQNGLVADLRPLLPKDAWADVNPGTLSALTSPHGSLIGYPYETETPLIYYNVDLFQKAGIQPATIDKPWTWDQLLAAAKRVSQPSKGIYGLISNWGSSQTLFKNGIAWQAGATPIHYKTGNYSIDAGDPGDRAAVNFLASFFKAKAADIGTLGADWQGPFLKGKAAMLLIGAWWRSIAPQTPADRAKTVNWAAMPMTKGKVANLGSGAAQTLSIPTASKNKEAAAEFIAWWGRPENVAAMCLASDQIPPNKRAREIVKNTAGASNYWDMALGEAALLKGQPYCPGWLAMLGKIWDPAMFDVFRGKLTIDQFVAKVNPAGTDLVQTAAGNY